MRTHRHTNTYRHTLRHLHAGTYTHADRHTLRHLHAGRYTHADTQFKQTHMRTHAHADTYTEFVFLCSYILYEIFKYVQGNAFSIKTLNFPQNLYSCNVQ